jgi:hypothetical protein
MRAALWGCGLDGELLSGYVAAELDHHWVVKRIREMVMCAECYGRGVAEPDAAVLSVNVKKN